MGEKIKIVNVLTGNLVSKIGDFYESFPLGKNINGIGVQK